MNKHVILIVLILMMAAIFIVRPFVDGVVMCITIDCITGLVGFFIGIMAMEYISEEKEED